MLGELTACRVVNLSILWFIRTYLGNSDICDFHFMWICSYYLLVTSPNPSTFPRHCILFHMLTAWYFLAFPLGLCFFHSKNFTSLCTINKFISGSAYITATHNCFCNCFASHYFIVTMLEKAFCCVAVSELLHVQSTNLPVLVLQTTGLEENI
jgi:hypothetical protein